MSFIEVIFLLTVFAVPYLLILAIIAFIENRWGPYFFPKDYFKWRK